MSRRGTPWARNGVAWLTSKWVRRTQIANTHVATDDASQHKQSTQNTHTLGDRPYTGSKPGESTSHENNCDTVTRVVILTLNALPRNDTPLTTTCHSHRFSATYVSFDKFPMLSGMLPLSSFVCKERNLHTSKHSHPSSQPVGGRV